MELQAAYTYIDSSLLSFETACRRKVGTTKSAACDRVAAANLKKIWAATDGSGWEARTLDTVRIALREGGVISSTTWAILGSMNGQDIEAIAFLVLMQAAKSAQEDLKAIMDAVKDINNAKQKIRGLLQALKDKATTTPTMRWPPLIYIAS